MFIKKRREYDLFEDKLLTENEKNTKTPFRNEKNNVIVTHSGRNVKAPKKLDL